MITTAIIFDHRGRAGNKPGPIEVRVTIDRKNYYVNTGIRVLKGNFVGGTVTGQHDAPEINKRLSIIYKRIQEDVNRYIEAGWKLDLAEIRRRAWMATEESNPENSPLIDWIEEQVPQLGLKIGTQKHYKTLVGRMREFGKIRHWNDLTAENICSFDAWLHKLERPLSDNEKSAGVKSECISEGTVYNYHKNLKALLYRAVMFGKIERNPYERLRGKFKKCDRERVEYLTEEDMRLFCETKPPKGTQMDVAHDLFIFQMYTGLSYSDTQVFSMDDYKLVDGRWVNTGERIKTGVPYVSQLLPPAVEVLEKYGWRVPTIANQRYNLCLKALGMVAGIAIPLHSHLARHTFATYMLRNGAKIENVSAMLGHTNIKQTQRYAKVLAQSVYDDFELIADKLKKKTQD